MSTPSQEKLPSVLETVISHVERTLNDCTNHAFAIEEISNKLHVQIKEASAVGSAPPNKPKSEPLTWTDKLNNIAEHANSLQEHLMNIQIHLKKTIG